MVDAIMNTIREFIEPLPTYEVWRGCGFVNRNAIQAANGNIAKREFRRRHGLKPNTPLNVRKQAHA